MSLEHEMDEWVTASAYEGLARAFAVGGDLEAAREARDEAVSRTVALKDPEDRAIIDADIATLPL
jgi:hypothetical protein